MPVVEIALIIQVGQALGVPPTIALILFTAVVGAYLLKREGLATLFRARQKMESGRIPAQEMGEGMMLAFAGALLLTPGFVTDVVGFSLLSGTVRRKLIGRFSSVVTIIGASKRAESNQHADHKNDYIDAEYHRDED